MHLLECDLAHCEAVGKLFLILLEMLLVGESRAAEVIERQTKADLDCFFVELDMQLLDSAGQDYLIVAFERELCFKLHALFLLKSLHMLLLG